MNKNTQKTPTTLMTIPEGFTTQVGPDGKHYWVPPYLIPALDQAFVAHQSKADQLSDQENFNHHAEVLALQERLEISYKDASHHLYLAEVEKLKVADAKHQAFKGLNVCIKDYIQGVNLQFSNPGNVDIHINNDTETSSTGAAAATAAPTTVSTPATTNMTNHAFAAADEADEDDSDDEDD
ncbi:hypothetical protein M413DRAFT_12460 [Hebeloma cylindrosporum]|uniref:Uncharacterized protein n=1 Tax=Hebeloma cylindrosporum TaxID=76867 RepID=A0A0C3C5C0_HEBCY|nr:hypothetical protein M413DRAFT_12460 [Hebeloma cylindrosporum h7]